MNGTDPMTEEKIWNGRLFHLNKPYRYQYDNGNKSNCIVELVRFLDDERGVAEARFTDVITDDSGNDFFKYLKKTNQTMNVSLKYLSEI